MSVVLKEIETRIKHKIDSVANWSSVDSTFIPLDGELIIYRGMTHTSGNHTSEETIHFKVGNGVSLLKDLPFAYDTELLELATAIAAEGDVREKVDNSLQEQITAIHNSTQPLNPVAEFGEEVDLGTVVSIDKSFKFTMPEETPISITNPNSDSLLNVTKITAITGLSSDGHNIIPSETTFTLPADRYHATGSWQGLTYNATSKGGAEELSFTIPTGNTSTTVAPGNHTHNYIPKLTYEWNKEFNAKGSVGYLLIGSFPMYDTNITIDIDATTNFTYHGTVVIATQKVSAGTQGSASVVTVYGDPTGTLSSAIRVVWSKGSNHYRVYLVPTTWSKNLIHIRAIGLTSNLDEDKICTEFTVGSPPETTPGIIIVNALQMSFSSRQHNHNDLYSVINHNHDGIYAPFTHVHDYIPLSQKGAVNGVATLDTNGLVPSSQLPSYVDDVINGQLHTDGYFYKSNNQINPQQNSYTKVDTPEKGKIYFDIVTNKSYRYSGNDSSGKHIYVEIPSSLALSNEAPKMAAGTAAVGTSSTAARGDHIHPSDTSKVIKSGDTLTGTLTFNVGHVSSGAGIKWNTIGTSSPFIGYASDQSDGTFALLSIEGTNYQSGLAIEGSSKNLLWKGNKVATEPFVTGAINEHANLVGSATVSGHTIVYPADSCSTYTSDTGALTPAAVKKAVGLFANESITYINGGTI